jgi:predicted HicB family RNase H-like nuclease
MANLSRWAGTGTGALRGADWGGRIGSYFTPIGTLIGTLLGAAGGGLAGYYSGGDSSESQGLRDYFFGTPEGIELYNQFSPDQQKKLSELLSQAMQQYQNPYEGFEPIKQNALNTFNQQIVPEISERFSASGRNALSSGVLHSQLSGASSDLSQRLAGMQSMYGIQNRDQALSALRLGLQPQITSTGYRQQANPGIFNNPNNQNYLGDALSQFYKAPKGQGFDAFHKSFVS